MLSAFQAAAKTPVVPWGLLPILAESLTGPQNVMQAC